MSPRLVVVPVVAVSLAAALPALGEDSSSLETLATVQESEKAQLDLQTIRKYGDVQGRFEVFVGWADAARPAPGTYTPRRVRYMANCEDGTMTLAAVGVMGQDGQVQKTIVAPPGSIDPVKPQKGSEQAKWLQRVCMF
jgi:hypothetical protein